MSTISLGRSGIVGISYNETSLLKSNLMRANERRNSASNNINSAKVKLQVNGRSGRIRVETDNLQSYYSSLKSNNSKIEKIIRDIDYIVRKFKEVDSRCASRVRAISRSYKVQSFISKIGNSLISFGNKVFNGVSSFFKDGINIIKSIYNSASNSVGSAYRSVTDWFDRHQLAGNIISFGLNALAVIGAGVTLVAGGPVIVVVGAVLGGALALNSLLDDGTKIYNNISNGSNKGFNGLEFGLKSVAGEKVGGIIYGGLNVADFALNIPHIFKGIGKIKTSLIDAGKAIKNFPSKVSGMVGTFKTKSIEAIKDAGNILKVGYNNYINDTKNFSLGSNLGGELNKFGSNIKKAAEDIKNSKKIQSGIDVYDNLSDSKFVKGVSKAEINTAESIKNIINGKGYSVDEFAKLLHPDRVLMDSEKLLVDSIRKEIGLTSADTLMCKVIPQSDIYKYLYNEYNGVRGFTAVSEHGANLTTLLDKYNGARLDYNNTAFKTTTGVDGISQSVGLPDRFYGTIEYKANDANKISIPDWEPKIDDYPYTGKGFTGSKDVVLPEYFQKTREFSDGDIFNIIDSNTGKIVEQFIYDMDTDIKWVMIGGN